MKKTVSLFLAAVMLFVCISFSIPVGAGPSIDPTYISKVEAKYFDVKPFIDGYVTEAEWGTPTLYASQEYAAKVGDTEPVAGENTFFAAEAGRGYDAAVFNMEFEAWLRWDEEFFYVAVKVYDPDGHALKNGRQNTWNGDAIQFRVDAGGSNSISFNDRFYPEDDLTGQNKPWDNPRICDIVLGYCELGGGFSEAYENSVSGGEYSLVATPYYTPSVELGIAPAGYTYSADTANGITTYEVAVPWIYIDDYFYGGVAGYDRNNCHKYADSATDKNGAIGRYYGMTLCAYNADGVRDAGMFNAALTWGSGIYNTQMREALATCGGSNEVYISADKVSADPAYTGAYDKYTEGGLPGYIPPRLTYIKSLTSSTGATISYTDPDEYFYVTSPDMAGGGWITFECDAVDTALIPVIEEEFGTAYDAYDTSLQLNSCDLIPPSEVEPKGEMRLIVPAPEGRAALNCDVYKMEDDNTFTKLDVSYVDGKLSFVTDELGIFIIVESYPANTLSGVIEGGGAVASGEAVIELQPDDPAIDAKYTTATVNGEYTLTGIKDGSYVLSAKKKGCTSTTYLITLEGGNVVQNVHLALLGDLTSDGEVTLVDLLMMRKYMLGSLTEQDIDINAAKVSDGETVSMNDLLEMRKYLLGLITEF